MILFQNWNIEYIGGLFARQYDNLSRALEVTGVPEGYDWNMMVQVGENFDILSLSPMEGGVGVVLTANQLSIAGYYKLQLVGTLRSDGVTKRHTNVLQVYVPGSLSGDANWPTVPSEFSQVEANIRELNSHPPIPGDNGYWMIWDLESHGYTESEFPLPEVATGTGGTNDHSKLTNRYAADQHPMSAITGLKEALDGKQPTGSYLTEETDPTVHDWAKAAQKPAYTASEVGADPSGTAVAQVAAHNTGEAAHSDIRLLIQGLTDRINALADSDDTTLDQLSEIVAYIKSNRDLISSITTSKVSVTDIVDDLVTSVADKPLSAAQGVALKALIDAISVPAATAEDAGKVPVVQADGSYGLGSMIPAPETAEVGQTIVVKAVDEAGKPTEWEAVNLPGSVEYNTVELTEEVSSVEFPLDGADEFSLVLDVPIVQSNMNYVFLLISGRQSSFLTANIGSTSSRCMSAFTIKKTTDGIWFLRFKQGNGTNYSTNGPASSDGVQILNNMIVADVTSFGIKCYLSQMFPAGTKIYTIKGGAAR